MKILIDCDDVIWDLITPWLEKYNHTYNDTLTVSQITDWDITKFVKPECGRKIYNLLDNYIYDSVIEIPHAKETIDWLRTKGHNIFFVTSGFHFRKAAFLVKHGFSLAKHTLYADDIIFCRDKSMINGDAIIDDRMKNLTGHRIKLLYQRPWNKSEPPTHGIIQVCNWLEIQHVFYDIAGGWS